MKPDCRKLLFKAAINVVLLISFSNVKAQICSVNAGVDKNICITQPLVLTGSVGSSQSTPPEHTWTKLSGPAATIVSPNSLTTNVTGITPGNYVFELSNKCIDGLYARDIITITVLPEPPTALAGNDRTICFNGPVQLSANTIAAPNTGTWTVTPAGGTFSPNANDPNAVYTGPMRVGTRKFTWTSSNGSCQKTDVVNITFLEPALPVTAGPDTMLTCKGKCVGLKGSYPGYVPQHGLWSVISAPNTPTFADPADHSTKMCNLVPGVYHLRWKVTGPCVNDSDDVVITVLNTNTPPPSLGDQNYNNFCETPLVTSEVLAGAPLSPGDTVTWTQISGGSVATFSPDNHHSSVTVGNLTGPFPYKFTYTHTSASGCTIVTTHTVYRSQPITGLTTPQNQVLPCDVTASSFNISYNRLSTISNSVTRRALFISGPMDTGRIEFINSALSGNTRTDTWNVSNLVVPGTYIYRVEYSNACGSLFRDISFTVSRMPGTVNAGSDIILPCHGLSVSPIGSVNAPGVFTWSQLNGPNAANITGEETLIPSIDGLIQGIYTIRLTNWAGDACPVKTDDMTITVTQLPPLLATTAPDTAICAGTYLLQGNIPDITETGTWTVEPADSISFYPDEHAPNAYATGLNPNSNYTFTWTVSNVCGSLSATQLVTTGSYYSAPVPYAGENICAAQGTFTTTLSGSDPGDANVLWTAITPGASISTPTQQQTDVSLLSGSGVYLFEYALGTTGCATYRDTVSVTVKSNTTVNAGSDRSICTDAFPYTVTMSGSISSRSGTYPVQWSQLTGPSNTIIASPNDLQTEIAGLQEGMYTFELSTVPYNDCEYISDTMQVNISREPSDAVAGPDQSICNASVHTVVNLSANFPVYGSGHWQLVSSPPGSPTPVFSDITSPVSTITNLTNGEYKLQWVIANGNNCSAKADEMDIYVNAQANAGSNVNVCNTNTIQLTGNANTIGNWSVVSAFPPVTITTNSGNTAIVNGLTTGAAPVQYVFRYTLPDAGACRGSFDDVTITNYPLPSTANAGGDRLVCHNENSVTLSGNVPVSGRGSWVWQSGPNVPVAGVMNSTSFDTVLNNLVAGIYTFQYRVSTNAVCPASTDNIQVIKQARANAQADFRICNAASINLNANVPLTGQGTWSYISGPLPASSVIFSDTHNPSSAVNGLEPGVYVFRWTLTAVASCTQNSDDIQVTVDPPVTSVDAGPNSSFCQGSATAFAIGSPATPGVSYSWSPTAMLSGASTAQPVFQGVNNPGNYVYTVAATIGSCAAFSSVTINVKPVPFANIEVLNPACTGMFAATFPGSGVSNPVYTWDFGVGTNPPSAVGEGPH
ncbi:MAG: hypothetical protein JST81_15260, partial [Bacteroidetes bacterium]|nr:hypothetical protein [Bacteroidota bacterium]